MNDSNSSSGAAMAPEPARERRQEQAVSRSEEPMWDDTPDAIGNCKGETAQSEQRRGSARTTTVREADHGATTATATD